MGWHPEDDEHDAKQATPREELEHQIMSASAPKNEREWWAHQEINRLREAALENVNLRAALKGLTAAVDEFFEASDRPRLNGVRGEWLANLIRAQANAKPLCGALPGKLERPRRLTPTTAP